MTRAVNQPVLGWVAPRESPSLNILSSGGDNSRIVLIGRPFAAPYLWIPAHLLPAAPNKAASSSP